MNTWLLILLAASAEASPARELAGWAAKAARKAGVSRVAVLPFAPLDGSAQAEGRRAAEALAGELARRGKVRVVERAQLPSVLDEAALGLTGALDPRGLVRTGALSQAQAVVVGSFVTMGSRMRIEARLVLVETGVAVSARSAEGRRDWYPADVIPEPQPISADQAVAEAYAYQTGRTYRPRRAARAAPRTSEAALPRGSARSSASELRDAPADPCAGAVARVNALQEDILELKARYWAAQARRRGFSAKALRVKPADTIPDAGLRRRFLQLMAECPHDDAPLDPAEVMRFVSADQRSFELLAACRPGK